MLDRPKAPLLTTINVTGNCNLHCNYCFYVPRKNINISIEDFKLVLNILKKEEIFLITLSGGEPFLHPDINKLIYLAHKKFPYVQILSNGTVLSDSNIERIKKIIGEKGGFSIQISLDSIDNDKNLKTRGDNKTVIENIKILKEIGANITISTVITKYNVEAIPEMILSMKKLTKSFHIMPFKRQKYNLSTGDLEVENSKVEKLWNELARLRSEYGLDLKIPCLDPEEPYCADGAPCMAGFSHIVIDPDLKVRACDRLTKLFAGDLKEKSFSEIWNGKELESFYKLEKPYCTY